VAGVEWRWQARIPVLTICFEPNRENKGHLDGTPGGEISITVGQNWLGTLDPGHWTLLLAQMKLEDSSM
jgi:hypothetical protein